MKEILNKMTIKKFEITEKCNLRCEACYNHELIKHINDLSPGDILGWSKNKQPVKRFYRKC